MTTDSSASADRAHLRILLVDDDDISRHILVRTLRKLGYSADEANSGLAAVEATERRDYDLILMDLVMPDMDGLDATARILKSSGGERKPRIVGITSSIFEGDQHRCRDAGMECLLLKPVRPDNLRAVLE